MLNRLFHEVVTVKHVSVQLECDSTNAPATVIITLFDRLFCIVNQPRMNRETFRLVLLVSCAHAMVHIYELTFSGIEQQIELELIEERIPETALKEHSSILEAASVRQEERTPQQRQLLDHYVPDHKSMIARVGWLGTAWTLPFGLGAVIAGWLADRVGSKRILIAYLIGCAVLSTSVGFSKSYSSLLLTMILMGAFASFYHPAGLSLISRVTDRKNRGIALGWHGIIGNIGITIAPMLATFVSLQLSSWRSVYMLLTIPGILLALILFRKLPSDQAHSALLQNGNRQESNNRWLCFSMYCFIAWLLGITYRAFTTFLPRYLESPEYVGVVLAVGIIGQYFSGHLASRFRLEYLLGIIVVAHIPLLLWMSSAELFISRLSASLFFSFTLFMSQPVGNSLVAMYISERQRSMGYGIAFLVSFGAGSIGAFLAGKIQEYYTLSHVYSFLSIGLVPAMICAAGLMLISRHTTSSVDDN